MRQPWRCALPLPWRHALRSDFRTHAVSHRRRGGVSRNSAERRQPGIRVGLATTALFALVSAVSAAQEARLAWDVAALPGVERIRFTTSHPKEFTQRLVDVYERVPQLVNHLHLPVQHGSDRILMAMKRGYTALEFKSTVRKLRAIRPDIAMSSDFIVGFPGETEEDFAKLMKLITDVGFDTSFSFIYSPRPGTPAANLLDETPHAVKLKRLQHLQATIEDNVRAISATREHTVQRILVEGPSKKDQSEWMGRTECNRIVNFPAGPNPERLKGHMLDVNITQALPHSLRGELVLK